MNKKNFFICLYPLRKWREKKRRDTSERKKIQEIPSQPLLFIDFQKKEKSFFMQLKSLNYEKYKIVAKRFRCVFAVRKGLRAVEREFYRQRFNLTPTINSKCLDNDFETSITERFSLCISFVHHEVFDKIMALRVGEKVFNESLKDF